MAAANDDLDDFFKKKDRKGNKHKKQPALLSNNQELLKQLGKQIFNSRVTFLENLVFFFQLLSPRQQQHLKKIWI